MKMKHYLYVACMFIAALAFTACSDDDDNSVKLANVTLHFNAPSELQSYNPTIGIQELTLKNINTGETTSVVKPGTRVTTSNASITVSVPEGLYTISMEGSLSYKLNDEMVYTKMRAYQESVTFTEATGTSPLDVTGYVYNSSEEGGNFVIAEIFFTGSVTPEEKQYTGDKYFCLLYTSDAADE